jgi:hypothetical protein
VCPGLVVSPVCLVGFKGSFSQVHRRFSQVRLWPVFFDRSPCAHVVNPVVPPLAYAVRRVRDPVRRWSVLVLGARCPSRLTEFCHWPLAHRRSLIVCRSLPSGQMVKSGSNSLLSVESTRCLFLVCFYHHLILHTTMLFTIQFCI